MKKIVSFFPIFAISLLANCGAKTYVVLWKNYNGEILERDDNVPEGTVPTFDGVEPTHPSDEAYTYKFSGWDPEIAPAHGDQIYTATYSQINKFAEIEVRFRSEEYTVTFQNVGPNKDENLLKVDWGDDSTTVSEDDVVSHTYKAAGTYNIKLLNFTSIVPYNTETKDIIRKISFPSSTTLIAEGAFSDCAKLKSVIFASDSQLETIGNNAFSGCARLQEIELRKTVTTIGENAFENCKSLAIFCEPETKPEGWDVNWNSSNRPCYWGCTEHGEQGDYRYAINSAGLHIVKYLGSGENIIIPNEIKGHSVVSIGGDAFHSIRTITSVTIPATVTSLGIGAFKNCENLASITFADGSQLETIGNDAFYDSSQLQEIELHRTVATIGANAFKNCFSLTIFCEPETKPDGWDNNWNSSDCPCYWRCTEHGEEGDYKYAINSAGLHIVKYLGSDTNVNIPNEIKGKPVVSIGGDAFCDVQTITSVTIPATVTSLGISAFENCKSLASITFADGSQLETIGNDAFFGCTQLREIELHNTVMTIGAHAFQVCSSLTIFCEPETKPEGWDVNWNSSNRPCYWGCTEHGEQGDYKYAINSAGSHIIKYLGLGGDVNIPDKINERSVISIDRDAFHSNQTITSVMIPATVTSLGFSAFENCKSLASITFANNSQLETIGENALRNLIVMKSISLPGTVKTIGVHAFFDSSQLQEIELHNTVTTIGANAFQACSSLTIFCEPETKPAGWDNNWNSSNCPCYWGCTEHGKQSDYKYAINSAGAHIVKYLGSDKNLVIPDKINERSVVSIGRNSFKENASLEMVSVPESIELIGREAFSSCSQLANINIPSSITDIDYGAFIDCSSLTSIYIPTSVVKMGAGIFKNCASLTIYCQAPSKPDGWDDNWNSSQCEVHWDALPPTIIK